MAGAKGAKLASRGGNKGPQKHYCPTCIKDSDDKTITPEMEAKAVMVMPGSRIFFDCKAGHRSTRKETILA